MYQLIVYLHVVGVFGFLLAHGASLNVALKLRSERNVERIRALLDLSFSSFILSYVSLLFLLITGIIAGFMGNLWGSGWIWTSLGILIALFLAMGLIASPYFNRLREAVGVPKYSLSTAKPLASAASEAEIAGLTTSSRPLLITAIGTIGLLLILWLMMFKPF